MRIRFLTICLGLVLSGAAALAVDTSKVVLSGHVPAAVAQLQAKGELPVQTDLNLAIGLPLRNREALTNLLQQIYDPASTNYHHYLTPEQFTAQFGPTEQDYQAVINFAQANGLAVTGTHPNRVVLDVTGKVGDIERAFNVTLRTYQHPTEARSFFAPDTEPAVSATLPILHVSGLDNYSIPHPNLKARPLVQPSGASPQAGSAPGGAYQGNDFRNAYVPGTPLTGAGQSVGLLQFDGYFDSDIAAYANQIGLAGNVPQLVIVPIDGGVPTPTPVGNSEVSLDIETVISMAPGLSKVYVYEAPNPSPWVDILSRMANDNLSRQLSCSWGGGPPDPVAEQIFQQMALQGQTFFNASGDSDAFTGAILFPSDSPHITEVGGTTLTTGPGAGYTSETVWNWGISLGRDGDGSSGGISTTYAIPAWQTNINMAARQGSTTMRNVPDVALTADNVWVIFGGGQAAAFGGTSCAAPLWAAFTALVNQQATNNGHASVGFINPAIYAIASSASYTNCFHDTTAGNNTWSASPGQFFAASNYDLCTGLGTPNGTNLINALAASVNPITHFSPPPPPYGPTLAALKAGDPNGNWALFVQDDALGDGGIISNGWFITLTTANPVGSAADLGISMTASPTNVVAGNNVVYAIAVTNYGGLSTASNVIVSDTLPLGVTLVSTNATQGSVIRSGFDVIWNVGTLVTNAGARLTLTVQTSGEGSIVNTAIASTTTPDANPDDDTASVTINTVVPVPVVLSGGSVSNGVFSLTITGTPGANYTIQASTNLVNWLPIYTNTSPFVFMDPFASNYPTRFYRALLGP